MMENLIKVNFRKHEVKERNNSKEKLMHNEIIKELCKNKDEFYFDEIEVILRYSPNFGLQDIDDYRFDFIANFIDFLTISKKSKFIDFTIVHENIRRKNSRVPKVVDSIMYYRELEIERGRGLDVTLEDLKLCYEYSDYLFRYCLMDLFVEYISEGTVELIKEIIGQDKRKLERLYNGHLEDRKALIMNRVYKCLR